MSKELVMKNSAYVCIALTAITLYLSLVLGVNISDIYYWGIIISGLLAIVSYRLFRRYTYLKHLRELKEGWGKEGKKKRDFSLIRIVRRFFI